MSAVQEMAIQTPVNLLQIAVEKGADVEQLGKLMDLQERWDKEQSRKDFYAARSAFQAQCPAITKDREVAYGNTKYKYATLAGIADAVKETMNKCGLTYRWEISDSAEIIQVTCILSHVSGHSESNPMTAAPDDSGAKNNIQQRGSTVSYLQRYTLIGALGIASAVEDDDGSSAGSTNVETLRKHMALVREHFDSIHAMKVGFSTENLEQAIEAWSELGREAQTGLWLAPTKGGVFTTEERKTMQSDEWAAAKKAMI